MKKEQLFTELSDEQAEKVVGGVGVQGGGQGGGAGAGTNGWGAAGTVSEGGGLCHAGFFGFVFVSHGGVTVSHPSKTVAPPGGCP
jgi:hypothetical protein